MKESLKLLVAEDGADEVVLLTRAFERAQTKFDTRFVRDGEEAMYYLAGIGEFADRSKFPLPAMMLMDLEMPRMGGFELLRWVRSQRDLDGLVVVILSSSDDQKDVNRAYKLGANSYLVKPSSASKLSELVLVFEQYWNTLNKYARLGVVEVNSLGAVG